jgi:hypothetical protein
MRQLKKPTSEFPDVEASDEIAMLVLPMLASNPTLTWRDAVAILRRCARAGLVAGLASPVRARKSVGHFSEKPWKFLERKLSHFFAN